MPGRISYTAAREVTKSIPQIFKGNKTVKDTGKRVFLSVSEVVCNSVVGGAVATALPFCGLPSYIACTLLPCTAIATHKAKKRAENMLFKSNSVALETPSSSINNISGSVLNENVVINAQPEMAMRNVSKQFQNKEADRIRRNKDIKEKAPDNVDINRI